MCDPCCPQRHVCVREVTCLCTGSHKAHMIPAVHEEPQRTLWSLAVHEKLQRAYVVPNCPQEATKHMWSLVVHRGGHRKGMCGPWLFMGGTREYVVLGCPQRATRTLWSLVL